LAAAFFVSSFVVHRLGNIVFGVWSLMMSLTGYVTVFYPGLCTHTMTD